MNATTLLVRRVKQGIAEWYRFQLKDKAWKGLREHALAGYNIGPVPYGYTAQRIPHPVAGQGRPGRHQDPPRPGPRPGPGRRADLRPAHPGQAGPRRHR